MNKKVMGCTILENTQADIRNWYKILYVELFCKKNSIGW